jgi:large subunit ribosomal protein L29
MKAAELKTKSVEELQSELMALLKEQFNLRIQRGVGQAPLSHIFRNVRKQIARVKTILREKEGSSS